MTRLDTISNQAERTNLLRLISGWDASGLYRCRLAGVLPLVAAFDEIADGEIACLQILFCRTCGTWQRAAQNAIFDRNGKSVFADLQNHLAGIREKLSTPLLAARIRLLTDGGSREKSLQIARRTSAFFKQFSSPTGNDLIPLPNDDLEPSKYLQSFLHRTTFRSGILLSVQELSSLVHLPSDSVKSQKLCRDENRTIPESKWFAKKRQE